MDDQQIVALRRPPADDEERSAADRMRDRLHDVTPDEDPAAQAAVADPLPAPAGTDLLLGRNEPGGQHLQGILDRSLG